MKQILFIGDAGSSHLTKWVLALHGKYCDVAIFSMREPAPEIKNLEGLKIFVHETDSSKFSGALISKFVYLMAMPELRKFVAEINPVLIHAHYASSYGMMAARLNKHPLIISAWGSDVFAFGDSALGRAILKYNFKKADKILSTSLVMKERVKQFTNKEILVTPFGVDTKVFFPEKKKAPFFPDDSFVFGMVKSMEDIYGVSNLIQAFNALVKKGNDAVRLLLVGSGTKLDEYIQLCAQLGISSKVHFTGRVPHLDIPAHHQMIDVFVNPSQMESFGVSVLEAMACGKPVVVTAVGGLKEIVQDQINGLYVQVDDVHDLTEKMETLLSNEALRKSLSSNARESVLKQYSWDRSVEIMIEEVYQNILNR